MNVNLMELIDVYVESEDDVIDWGYVLSLGRLQQSAGLRSGNKLRKAHTWNGRSRR